MKLLKEFEKHQDLFNKGFRFNPVDGIFFAADPKKFKKPEGYEEWEIEKFDREAYLNERLAELKITPEMNSVELIDEHNTRGKQRDKMPVFTANKYGDIEILQYTLHRAPLKYVLSDPSTGVREEYRVQKRLHPNSMAICEGKYDFSEAANAPFWHPELIRLFEGKEEIETLVITEGQFKAWKATQDGIPTVGLTSISHFKDKHTGEIHTEIIEFIRECKVKNVVILWDGDCRDISTKKLEKGEDLAERPLNFYRFATKIRDLISKYIKAGKFKIHFATIQKAAGDGSYPKGIDDLLIYLDNPTPVKTDIENIGTLPGRWIYSMDITQPNAIKDLYQWFGLKSVSEFYQMHREQIQKRNFVFLKSTYRIEEGIPRMEINKDLKNFVRVGDNYYEKIMKPFLSPNNTIINEETLVSRSKQTITDDYGKNSCNHIDKYKDFVNIANHIEFQPVINNCYNLYNELKHEPRSGEWPHIKALLQHIFQEQYEMILDYISVLYHKPIQKLPVICLTSKLQKTGKSTFVYLMKLIFRNNMMLISNEDFIEPFNDHWITKLIVACEETVFEKRGAYEKIKSLSTGQFINRKEKNKTAAPLSNMLHFIFCSNHEDDFIKIDDTDSRLWIRKVGTITERYDDFEQKLEDEVDYFIHYILNRKIAYTGKIDRLYFEPQYYKTDAFHNVVKHSEPTVIKEIREVLEDSFLKFGGKVREMTAKDLNRHFQIRGEVSYLNKVIKQYLKAERIKNSNGQEYVRKYSFPIDDYEDPTMPKYIDSKGRPFEFHVEDILSPDQLEIFHAGDFIQAELPIN